MSGWVKLHRVFQESSLWRQRREFSRAEAWLDILMTVNWKADEILIGGTIIKCERGQALLSLDSWAKRWGWGTKKVRLFFDLLRNENMIKTENVQKTTRLTVCNYDKYQDEGQAKDTQRADEGHAKGTQRATIEEYKEVEERKNINRGAAAPAPGEMEECFDCGQAAPGNLQEAVQNVSSLKKETKKIKTSKGGPELKPIAAQVKEHYMAKYPEYYWEAKDSVNLNKIISKLEHTAQASRGSFTEEDILKMAKHIIDHLPEWMEEKQMTTIGHINSQYNSIVEKIKQQKHGKENRTDTRRGTNRYDTSAGASYGEGNW